jgi:uncharacterized protein YutE (UPF0331/DUF86 family)
VVNRDILAAKLAELSDRVGRVRAHRPDDPEGLTADRDALDLVSFNLMLAVQTCADIASYLIADEAWPAARNLAESFTRLEERGVLDAPTAASLRRAVGLRNVVAHGYAGVDVQLVYDAATAGLADLESFAQQVASWLSAAP